MNIQWHELKAYKREIEVLEEELQDYHKNRSESENLTHFSLSVSNRGHLIIIGLCSLVEATLLEIALEEEKEQCFKLRDINGSGITKLQKYLSRSGRINFGEIAEWGTFKHIYELRNTLIHSYGGLIETSQIENAKKSINQLNLDLKNCLVGDRRIRLGLEPIRSFHSIANKVIDEILQ